MRNCELSDQQIDEIFALANSTNHKLDFRQKVRAYLPGKPELSERTKLLATVAAIVAANSTTANRDPKTIITRSCDWASQILVEVENRQK